ncbi:MAG: porin family protein [Bacteroidetes bacterium]|nr:porin family protein [Bacteroidota bacterium]
MEKIGLFVLFIFAFTLNPTTSFSQTLASEGTTIISGGGIGAYSTWDNPGTDQKGSRYNLNLYCEYSMFFTDQLALGLMFGPGYSNSKSGTSESTTVSYDLGPLVRFFPAPEASPLFLFGSFRLSYSKTEFELILGGKKQTIKMDDDYKMVGFGLGYQLAVTESWAFEPSIEYSRVIGDRGNTENYSQIMVGVTISTYLPAE